MELQAGDLKSPMADYSTTAGRIRILFHGGCWARRQLHGGIRYIPVAPKPMTWLSSVEGVRVALAEFYSMADSSTTAGLILFLYPEGSWARRQLRNGIRFIPIASKLMKSWPAMEVL